MKKKGVEFEKPIVQPRTRLRKKHGREARDKKKTNVKGCY